MRDLRLPRAAAGLFAFVLTLSGCGFFAVKLAPKKTAHRSDTELARRAQSFFRESLAAGRYDELPEATRLLTAAYLENPAILPSHFCSEWRISGAWRSVSAKRNKIRRSPIS